MFVSLTARITAIGLVVVIALGALAGLLADASYQSSESFRWAAHSAGILETTEAALGDLREAESGQRGFVVTRNAAYARSFTERMDSAAGPSRGSSSRPATIRSSTPARRRSRR